MGTLTVPAVRILGIAVLALTLALTSAPRSAAGPRAAEDALFAGTASRVLTRDFSRPDISYLLYEVRTGALLASRWNASDEPIPVGSLVKPFTALAYAESHNFRYPEHTCGANACWRPQGHGRLGIVRATALSCNVYFTELAAKTSAADVTAVAHRFGLNGPGANASPEVMAGKFGVWRESPQALARSYAELLGRRLQPGIRELVQGMARSAKDGTAAGVSSRTQVTAVAKTGTAPCTHQEHAPGDGFVLVAWPADAPRYLLLAREHGKPGAQAAVLAGRMLRALEAQP